MFINQILTKLKSLVYSKSETDSLLGGKANSSHTHTKSQITDFPSLATVATSGSYNDLSNKPTILTDTNQLTNGAGFITSSGSCNYANSAGSAQPVFNNGTWYAVGDDAAIGDHNVGGGLGVKALNSTTTRIDLCYKDNAANYKSITYDGTTLYMNGNCDYAASAGSVAWSNVSGKPTIPTNTNQLTNGAGFITSSGSCNYANSAGNSDTLDSYHEYSFLRYRGNTSTSGEGTLWAQIGIKDYNNALPDGLSGVYQWGEVVSLAGGNGRFEIYCSHNSSNGNGLYYRSGWANDKKAWKCFIDSANIGSQSVNYANSSGNADTVDGSHAWQMQTLAAGGGVHGSNDWLMQCQHNVDGDGYFKLYCGDKSVGTKVDRASSAGYADSAGSVAWDNVSGRPWAVSQFTNDSGFITSAVKESSYDDNGRYCLLYGGLLIQFGTAVFSAQSGNVTFRKAFSSAPIVIVNYGDDVGFGSPCCLDEAYTTYFTATNAAGSELWRCNWIAIGRA